MNITSTNDLTLPLVSGTVPKADYFVVLIRIRTEHCLDAHHHENGREKRLHLRCLKLYRVRILIQSIGQILNVCHFALTQLLID